MLPGKKNKNNKHNNLYCAERQSKTAYGSGCALQTTPAKNACIIPNLNFSK